MQRSTATRLSATCSTVLVSRKTWVARPKVRADRECLAKCYSDRLGQLWTLHCTLRLHDVVNDPTTSSEELHALHESGQNLLMCLQQQMLPYEAPTLLSDDRIRSHAELCRTYCFASALVLLLAAIGGSHQDLGAPSKMQRAEVVDLLVCVAQRAQVYRPLGSLGATWALAIAWASSSISAEKKIIEDLIFEQDVACFKLRTRQMMQQADCLFTKISSSSLKQIAL